MRHVVKQIDENHRLVVKPDEYSSFEDLAGDTFNREVNPDISEEQMAREEKAERRRIDSDGVWGLLGEYRCPCCQSWIEADSCWGFVGDDWRGGGHDTDIEAGTIQSRIDAIAKIVAMGKEVANV